MLHRLELHPSLMIKGKELQVKLKKLGEANFTKRLRQKTEEYLAEWAQVKKTHFKPSFTSPRKTTRPKTTKNTAGPKLSSTKKRQPTFLKGCSEEEKQ